MATVKAPCLRPSRTTSTTSGDWPDWLIPTTSAPSRDGGARVVREEGRCRQGDRQPVLEPQQVLGVAGRVVGAAPGGQHHEARSGRAHRRADALGLLAALAKEAGQGLGLLADFSFEEPGHGPSVPAGRPEPR